MTDVIEPENTEAEKGISSFERDKRKGISLSVHNLEVNFGGTKALSDLTFSLDPGDRLGVIGNTGAGKTTLCAAIAGTSRRYKGKVLLNSKTARSSTSRARMGVRQTSPHPVIFEELSLVENVLIGLPPSKGDGVVPAIFFPRMLFKEKRDVALRILEHCHVDVDETSDPATLPFSTKKKIELARALMGNPRVLILDDLSLGLTQEEQAQYCQVILDCSETFFTTVVVADSNIEVIRTLCPRAIALDAGELLADGEIDAVLRNDDVVKRFTGAVVK